MLCIFQGPALTSIVPPNHNSAYNKELAGPAWKSLCEVLLGRRSKSKSHGALSDQSH